MNIICLFKKNAKESMSMHAFKDGIVYISVEIIYPWIVPKREYLLKLGWVRSHESLMSFENEIVTKKVWVTWLIHSLLKSRHVNKMDTKQFKKHNNNYNTCSY
jgi:hypothetical protein